MATRHSHSVSHISLSSPKSPTTIMVDRALSSRRSQPYFDTDFPSPTATSSIISSIPESTTALLPDDESKTKKPHLYLLTSNYISRFGLNKSSCLCLLLLSLLVILSLILNSRHFVCVSSYDPISRLSLFGLDGVDSDFGSLGVPWYRNMEKQLNGHSTWVLRQAIPDTPIISITPRHPEKYLKKGPAYVDGNCSYFAGKDFVDFGSVNWEKVLKIRGISDFSRVLVFFDDHQNELKRLKQALKAGFRHLVFEDNYDTGTGDHYSLRQICDQFYIRGGGHSCFRDSDEARIRLKRKKFWEKAVDVDELCGPHEAWWGVRGEMRDNFSHNNTVISYGEHFQNSRFVESILDIYWELPPTAGPSLTHQTRYDPGRAPPPIVEDGRYRFFQRLGLDRLERPVFNGYTQMVYLQISKPES